MRWLWLIPCLALIPGAALAEQVLVSIGNGAQSTRLILTFEQLPKWSSRLDDRRLELAFEGAEIRIDSADQDGAAQNPRIDGLSAEGDSGRIAVQMACDCAADVYPFGASSLVVELRDPLSPAPVENVQVEPPAQPKIPDTDLAVAEALAPAPAPVPMNVPEPPSDVVEASTTDTPPPALPWPSASAGLDVIDRLGFAVPDASQTQAVEMLSRELSRAAAQGLIAPEADVSETGQAAGGALPARIANRSNIKIVTSLDRAVSVAPDGHAPTDEGNICFTDRDVDLAAWGDTTNISTIGALRHAAYGEDGEVTPRGAKALARYYISLGFGVEAAAAAFHMKEGRDKALLLALAEIVDHGRSTSSVLDGQIYCQGQVALWAALAKPIDREMVPDSVDIILATFSALSPHQRAHLGPVLAERLREVGLEAAARNAVNAVARGGLQSNESELVTARMELGGTRPDKARDTLVEISNGTDVTAAEALLELLEDAERREMAPNPVWVEDAPSLARATEGNEIASTLNLAGLRGRIALGQFDALRHALAEDTPGLNADTRGALARMAIVAAAHHADDGAFLRSEVGLSKLYAVDQITEAGRFDVAARLLSIGLASRARAYVLEEPGSNEALETLIRVYAATGDPQKAILLLTGREDAAAARQLGIVLSQIGQNGPATRAFERSGAVEDAAQSALRAGDWTWLAARDIEGQTGALSDAARSLAFSSVEKDAAKEDEETPANGRLILATQDRRRHVQTLLTETEIAPDGAAFTN
ncbi:MAG: hypothetical protein OIF48_01855 [Silicimonas sp.]|nr:hypothetical protein [Silicimonas sp.]